MNVMLLTIVMFASMMALLTTGRQVFLLVGTVATVAAMALWGTGGQIPGIYLHGLYAGPVRDGG